MDALSQLLLVQNHTDTFVLQVSTVGIMPFFVENVSALQLSAMKLIRSIYSKYEKHRDLIMEDIFASLARLPTSKKSMRTYKLSGDQCIQMVTALVLQMVQCIVINPRKEKSAARFTAGAENGDQSEVSKEERIDMDLMMSFTTASTAAKTFLSTFMKKCCAGGKDDDDFKPLFEGFIQDLLITLHLPEWPAAELLLMLLGGLLTQSFMNKSNDTQVRLLSLEHLGTIAARLRRDAVRGTEEDNDTIVNVLSQVLQCKIDAKPTSPIGIGNLDAFSENTQHLQRALVSFLNKRSQMDPASSFARDFCIGQWMSDLYAELDKASKLEDEEEANDAKLQEEAQSKKKFLRSLLKVKPSEATKSLEGVLTDQSSVAVVRFLASFRSLSKSFDYLLKQLLMVLKDSAVHVRTKAMKSLSTVVAVDPAILSRNEVCHSIQYHIADGSALVREAAVELLGKFVLNQPDLVLQYYDMLVVRMLDTSVSVRKRVIKIFKDICTQQEQFPKAVDVYSKMLRRIGDEEGVKNLVANVFHALWFTLPQASAVELDKEIRKRASGIMAVLSSDDVVHEYFEMLLRHLLKSEKGDKNHQVKSLMSAYQVMVDAIVKMILALEEDEGGRDTSSSSPITLPGCVTTLYLFSKVESGLLVNHATTIQPYLSIKCTSENDVMVIVYIARILEKVVPLMAHPDQSFLNSIEEEMVKLILKQGPNVLQACVGCMDAVANKVTRNYKLVVECFQKFYMFLERVRTLHTRDKNTPQLVSQRSLLLRSLYVVSLMCKHFDFDEVAETFPLPQAMLPVKGKVFGLLMYFTVYDDDEVCLKAVSGLGFFCVRYPHFMLENQAKGFYLNWLGPKSGTKQKLQILRNLLFHFSEDEARWKERHGDNEDALAEDSEALADLGDQLSLVNSQVAQMYAKEVFNCYLDPMVEVRLAVVHVVSIVLKLGLVPPAQCIPWLITMVTDSDSTISAKASKWISDLDSRYGGFTQNQLMIGAKNSYEFQRLLVTGLVRGCTEDMSDPQSLLSHVYTLLRSSKQKRRPFLRTMVNHCTDTDKNSLAYLLYLADNLAYLPYNLVEEPLFVIHEVDMALSVHGATVYQKFRDVLSLGHEEDDDNETFEVLSQRQTDLGKLNSCCGASQSCFLLLNLSQHLKLCYNLNDSKCSKYNPNESTKQYDKATNKKVGILFNPLPAVEYLRRQVKDPGALLTQEECLQVYMQFKTLMNSMDPFEDKLSPEPMDVPPPKPMPTPQVVDSTEQPGDGTEVDQSPDTVQSLELSAQKKGRPRLSSNSSGGSSGSKKLGRPRKNSADSLTKSSTKKRRKLDSDSDPEDTDYVM
jgi:cohesin loading factor subunit SCC2